MEAGIEFFIHFFRETPYTGSNLDLGAQKVIAPMLESFFQIFAST